MKKVEVARSEIQLPGKDTKIFWVYYEWQFIETEKQEIRRALRNEASKEHVEDFVRHLEFFCNAKKERLEQPPPKDIRDLRQHILTDCIAALSHLKQIARGKMILWHNETLDHYGSGSDKGDSFGDLLLAELQRAREAVGPLEKFVKSLEKYHRSEIKKIGRKRADSDHFVRKIRDIYFKHIGKPTAYPKGPFFTIVQISLEHLGLHFNDPSRTIKAALKNK